MEEKKRKRKIGKIVVVLSISIASALLITTGYYLGVDAVKTVRSSLRSFENASLNWRFNIKGLLSGDFPTPDGSLKKKPEGIFNRLIIAGVDDAAINHFGSFPFDRKVWANMLDAFNQKPLEQMPSLVFFDIVFTDPSQKPESDQALSNSFANYKGVLGEDIMSDVIHGKEVNLQGASGVDADLVLQEKQKLFFNECSEYTLPSIQALKRFELKIDPKNYILRPTPKWNRSYLPFPDL